MLAIGEKVEAPKFENVPSDLKQYPNWVLWKAEPHGKELSKVPYQPNKNHASSVDSNTWGGFETIKKAFNNGGFTGIGFVLSDNVPYSVLDLDGLTKEDVRHPNFNVGFVEKSPSGKGLHFWFKGKLPEIKKQKSNNVEYYQAKRFITFTGNSNNGDTSISEQSNDMDGLEKYLKSFGFHDNKNNVSLLTTNYTHIHRTNGLTNDEIIDSLNKSDKYAKLFSGDYSEYPSDTHPEGDHSNADQALINKLAKYTNSEPERMDSIFRRSGLMRDKWDSKRGKSTYGQITIENATSSVKHDNFYLSIPGVNDSKKSKLKKSKIYSYDDTGNSERMFDRFGEKYKYDTTNKATMVYDGKRWKLDETHEMQGDFNKVVKDLGKEELHLPEGYTDDDEQDAKKIRGKFIKRSRQHAGKVGALEEFKNLIALSADSFDTDNSVVNTPLGTWHVEEKKVTPHNCKDLITKITSGTPEQSHDCPKWKKFINETFEGDKDVIQFMQRAIGYSLLGDNRDRKMFVLHGVGEEHNGSNGKSLFVETIAHVLNDYATVMSPSSLIKPKYKKDGGEATPDLVALKDKRFVYTSELNTDDQIDEAKLKEITGDRAISTRALYDKEKRSLKKTFTIFMVTNHKPTISGTEGALWDRVIFVPFAHWVSSKEANTNLFNEFVEEETNGILNWIYEGANDYLKQGLNIPQTIISNGQQYKKDQDVLGEFVDECLQFDDLQIEWTSTRDIKNACQKWLTQNHKPFSDITKYLGERYKAYAKRKKSSRGYYAKLNDLSVPFHIVSKAVQK